MTKKKTKTQHLRVAVIGAGGMGTGHCQTIKHKVPEMKLAAVMDNSLERAEEVGKKFKVPGFNSVKDLVKSGICDAVINATPHPFHFETSVAAMKAGLHVLCEKPLAETISSADKMVAAAKKYKVTLAVMFQRRFEPAIEKAIQLVNAGKLGKLHRSIMISPEFRTQAYYDSGSWRATWKGEGGGVMMNQAPHVIDIFVQLAGVPVSVIGKMETRMHYIEVEDFAEATLKYKDGGSGYFYCSTNEPQPGQMIEVYGDKGKLIWRDGKLKFFTYTPSVSVFNKKTKEMWSNPKMTEVKLKLSKKKAGHFHVMRNFARHILFKEKLLCSGESGLASLELTNAIMLSAFKNKEIKLPVSRRAYDAELKRLRKSSTFKKKVRAQKVTDPHH